MGGFPACLIAAGPYLLAMFTLGFLCLLIYRIRRKREKADEDPNDIYHDVKAREWLRRDKGLPPRAVVLPWTQADDDRIIAMQKAAVSAPPLQPEQSRDTGDAKPESPEGGNGT